jgi:hypothetical protein
MLLYLRKLLKKNDNEEKNPLRQTTRETRGILSSATIEISSMILHMSVLHEQNCYQPLAR